MCPPVDGGSLSRPDRGKRPVGARARDPTERCAAGSHLRIYRTPQVLEDCQQTLGAVFGTDSASRDVGITGRVSLVELDGPIVVVSLSGRFWRAPPARSAARRRATRGLSPPRAHPPTYPPTRHQRSVVIDRVSSYVMERIPECVGVEIDDVAQLDDSIVE